jgi:5-methylcytosine-specific restriction endonuclease McrA
MSGRELIDFLKNRMSMTDLYQPVIIRDLLLHEGARTKKELAAILASYDASVQEYSEKIVMCWPKITLTKHGIVSYQRQGSVFHLSAYPDNATARQEAVALCEAKITEWLDKRRSVDRSVQGNASIRYTVLKEAHGKCQLCGIPAEIRPIDIDHIVPRSKADKNGKIRLNGRMLDIDDKENLQALCFTCNRAKRASDETDFRRRNSWCATASPPSSKPQAGHRPSKSFMIRPCAVPSTTSSARNMQNCSTPRTQAQSAKSLQI